MSTTPTLRDAAQAAYELLSSGLGIPDAKYRVVTELAAALTQGAGATIEWQVRGRHHYEWRRASEEIARAMYLLNPGHVRAVTVVEGAVPKGGL